MRARSHQWPQIKMLTVQWQLLWAAVLRAILYSNSAIYPLYRAYIQHFLCMIILSRYRRHAVCLTLCCLCSSWFIGALWSVQKCESWQNKQSAGAEYKNESQHFSLPSFPGREGPGHSLPSVQHHVLISHYNTDRDREEGVGGASGIIFPVNNGFMCERSNVIEVCTVPLPQSMSAPFLSLESDTAITTAAAALT